LAASVSGESISPSVSCMIQNLLGLSCMTMDINAACSAFDFLLETAAGFFARGKVKKVLVIGAERLSRLLDWNDRGTAVIFGDGAGAVVLEAGENYLDAVFDVKGGDDVIDIPQPVGMSPFYERGQEKKPYIHMAGQETFKFAVTAICRDCKEILERNGLTFDDIAYIVPHQANQRIIDFASTKLKVPKEKFYLNIHKYGNTSSSGMGKTACHSHLLIMEASEILLHKQSPQLRASLLGDEEPLPHRGRRSSSPRKRSFIGEEKTVINQH